MIIATVAFGMEIDCLTLDIFHLGAHEDVESYIQETGRADRDGSQSTASYSMQNKRNGKPQ